MAFGSNRFHSVGVLFVFYMAYYWFKVVHRPRVYFHANALNEKVIQKCKSIGRNYWPLFLFHNQYCQLFIGIILGKLYPILFKPNYHREMFTLQDGQNIALDWIYPQTPNPQVIKHNIPICIALYGVAGDNKSFNIYRYCSLIASKLNFYCVVLGRRGHEVDIPLTVPKMTIFGGQEDLHVVLLHMIRKYPNNPLILLGDSAGTGFWARYMGDLGLCLNQKYAEMHNKSSSVLLHMNRKYPNNPLILIGDSAGTGFWVRYLGDLGLCLNQKYADMHNKSSSKLIPKQYKNAYNVHQQILCAVLICPGYDSGEALFNMNWLARKLVLLLMKKTYVSNHKQALMRHNKDTVDKCSASNSCIELYHEFSGSSLSGYDSYNQFLLETNPVGTFKYIQTPLLTINARDDPICTNVCLDQWKSKLIPKQYQNAQSVHQQILCSVLICPGYDTSEAVSNIQNWVARKLVLFLMKRTYIANHKRVMTQHNKDIVDKCSASNSCIELYRDFSGSSLAGYGSYNQFLLETNPVETVPYIESPLLTVNSRDDPISTNVCLDQWKWVFSDERYCKHAILVETEYGSHSVFMSMFGGFYLDNV
eukprot:963172_1